MFHSSAKSLLTRKTQDTSLLQRIEKALQDYLRIVRVPQIEAADLRSFAQRLLQVGMMDAAARVNSLVAQLSNVEISH